MRKPMLAGNWKMNHSIEDLPVFFNGLANGLSGDLTETAAAIDLTIAMPATMLAVGVKLAQSHGVKISSQNIHWEASGAYTGELSGAMIKEVGVETCLIGHSERRQYFAETNTTVAKKVAAALGQNFSVIACVGESQTERESGLTEDVVRNQLSAILNGAGSYNEKLIIAYEPVWAIGTGLAATSSQAQSIHQFIRAEIALRWGNDCAEKIRILYGGSMKPENTKELIGQKDIDGGLIGGASLRPDLYAKMIEETLGCL